MEALKFGTSGLRGLVSDLVGGPSFAYALAFLRHVASSDESGARRVVYLGRDLRGSSPEILGDCAAAAAVAGFEAIDCGALPTPALAFRSLREACPAIMVTGSHIPDDRNGLKFYGRDGEITKADEAGILAAFAAIGDTERNSQALAVPEDATALDEYEQRYLDCFLPDALGGLRIGVYQHSSVARDLLMRLLKRLGAQPTALARSDRFIPVDTEAHRPEDVASIAEWTSEDGFDAIVSTDGDGDRPLIADERGTLLRGDLIGLLTARHLDLTMIVTPVTSSASIERAGIADRVVRTRVGSPFVIAGMAAAAADGAERIAGFEANGGFLLYSDVVLEGVTLTALPTRDAVLPMIAVLAEARERGKKLSELVSELDAGHAAAHRLANVPGERSAAFLTRLSGDENFRHEYFAPVGTVAGIDTIDGVRTLLADGSSIHYRASGNAPELRCYVEAGTEAEAARLLAWGLKQAGAEIG
ncbi:phosphomannomutase [Aurantimonas aggregata]|uniref:Phosphomannomutase n=1 Tax=Aurantimonas aggregata TaxID=2047720 RepID=A0A6L9MGI1_9HYPH|nr:phosphomannomutase [Aurantimonas aggregata]NDV86925.1 phosphomannomutase [Aurantimonas aggregata]